jgi:transcriptional regulator with XRE-family HTH domain
VDTAASDPESRPAKRQQLGAELRRLRDLAGVSGRELAQRVGISQSKISRIEAGSALPSLPDVVAWGEALNAPPETQQWLASLTEAAFTEVHPWRAALQKHGHLQDDIQEREAQARRVRTFQPSVVPGLLQTAEYARRVFSLADLPYAEEDLAAAVAGRLHRQLAVFERGRRFEFLITEAALRWRPGQPSLLLAQLDRISSISTMDNVSIGLIPFGVLAVTLTSHAFVLYDGHDDEHNKFVTVEAIHASLTANDPDDVVLYENRWSSLRQMALFDQDARKFLADLAIEFQVGAE